MPGITGIIHDAPTTELAEIAARMGRQFLHGPGLLAGCLGFPAVRAAFGWVHRPGSFAAGAPVWNASRTVAMILSGEVFDCGNDRHIADGGGQLAVLRLYEEYGPGFVERLNGWFSGVIVDLAQACVILFNDRYGLGRVYYYDGPKGFLFSSEAKSLLAILPESRELDQRGLAEFHSVGCVLQDRTLFRQISLLPPGSRWTFHRDGRLKRARYFKPEQWEQQDPLDAKGYGERLAELFPRIVRRYFEGAGAVGLSMTGGIDSRMVLAWAPSSHGNLPCYSFNGPYRECHDLKIARRLAAVAGQPHTTISVGKDFYADFADLAERTVHISDGAMDVSGSVELYANACAARIAPVRVTGNYGSEILRSNIAFRPGRVDRSHFASEFEGSLDEAAETYRAEANCHRLSFIAFKQVPWHHYARLSIEQSQITVRSPFLDNDLVSLAYQAPRDLANSPQPALALTAMGNPAMGSVPTDRGLLPGRTSAARRMLAAWQEFTAKLEYACDYGMPQRLAPLDHTLRGLGLKRLILGTHKFYHFRCWYQGPLKAYLLQQADELCNAPLPHYAMEVPSQLIHEHVRGRSNHTLEIHKLMSIHLLQKLLHTSWVT